MSVTLAAVVETQAFGGLVRRIEIYRATGYAGHPRLTGQRGYRRRRRAGRVSADAVPANLFFESPCPN